MAEIATSIPLQNQLNVVALNMDRSFCNLAVARAPANLSSLRPEIESIFKFDICIKRSHRLQLMDLHGVPWATQTTPPTVVLNHRTEFPFTAAWPYLTRFFSSIAQNVIPLPLDLLHDTVCRIFTYAVDASPGNPRAGIVHVKADLTVEFLTTEVQQPPVNPVLTGRRDWVRVDDSVVIAGEPVGPPVHPILAGRRNWARADDSVVTAGEPVGPPVRPILAGRGNWVRVDDSIVISGDTVGPPVRPILEGRRDWVRVDDSVVIAGEPVGHPVDIPRQPKRRSERELKERYGFRASEDNLGDCAVCLEELAVGGGKSSADVLKMPCSHVFHCRCLCKWLQRSDSCPLCRSVIP